MLKWVIIFALISMMAGIFGSRGSADIAKTLFFIFIAAALIFVVLTLLGIGPVS